MASVGDWSADDLDCLRQGLNKLSEIRSDCGISVDSLGYESETLTIKWDEDCARYVIERIE